MTNALTTKEMAQVRPTGDYCELPICDFDGTIIPFGERVIMTDYETLEYAEDFDYQGRVDYSPFILTETYWVNRVHRYQRERSEEQHAAKTQTLSE